MTLKIPQGSTGDREYSANWSLVAYSITYDLDGGAVAVANPTGYKFDLPTEAQWEYACRAGTTTALNNGKNLEHSNEEDQNLSEVAWYYQNWGESSTLISNL